MRYVTDIQIDEVVAHILDPWQSKTLTLSERAIPLAGNERLEEYFIEHIQNSLQDPIARAARFDHIAIDATSGLCDAALSGRSDLVTISCRLAERLYELIASDRRISAGDLAVCRYRADGKPYLALLKIDPSEAFRHKAEHDENGIRYVSFVIESSVLPTTRERLQKCAFIQPLEPRSPYDMLLLDRQVGTKDIDRVAKFFSGGFLGATLTYDARQLTDRLYRGLVTAQNALRREGQLTPGQDEYLRHATEMMIAADRVDIETSIDAFSLPEGHRQRIFHEVTKLVPDRAFDIDTSYAQQLAKKRKFRGDYELRVELLADHFDQMVTVESVDGSGPRRSRVVILTEKWEEVL